MAGYCGALQMNHLTPMYLFPQTPCQFDDELVLRQLRYTGMMETVKIRKSGYSVRVDFKVTCK